MEQESNASNDDAYVISAMASAEQLNEHVCVNEGDSQIPHIDGIQSPQVNAWFNTKGLNITHLNIHYLYPKLDQLELLVLEQTIDSLCSCEIFLNSEFSDNELLIPGYDFIRKGRNSHGGGLIIYTKENLVCIHREDLEIIDTEMLWMEVRNNVQKPFLIFYCYRSPSALNLWTENVRKPLKKLI